MVLRQPNVVLFLLERFPEGVRRLTRFGETALHLACNSEIEHAPQLIHALLQAYRKAAKVSSRGRFWPLHTFCASRAAEHPIEILDLLLQDPRS